MFLGRVLYWLWPRLPMRIPMGVLRSRGSLRGEAPHKLQEGGSGVGGRSQHTRGGGGVRELAGVGALGSKK